jgi:5'-nucleotidase
MRRIGVDLDGVCYEFVHDARVVCAEHLGVATDALPEVTQWDFFEQWGLTPEEFWRIWFKDVERGRAWNNRPPTEGATEALTSLRDRGHTIHIVTSRKGGEAATMSWISKHDLPYDTVTIGRDKTVVNIDLLLDDWEGNYLEVTQAGGHCVLFDQPWNRHVIEAPRVHGWADFIRYVEETP